MTIPLHYGLIILFIQNCLSHPIIPRSQGTSVSPVTPEGPPSAQIIPGWRNSTAIVLLVAMISLALTIPMFVYIWMKRRRLIRVRTQPQEQEDVTARKASFASTVDMPLASRAGRRSIGARSEAVMEVVTEVGTESGTEVGTEVVTKVTTTSTTGIVAFAEPVKMSVMPIRAVEIMVKPAKAAKSVFKDPSWEKLKS